MFGDGYDTGVFNFLQALFTYTINSSNVVNIFYGGNLGRTGLNAKTYSGTCAYGSTAPGCFGTVGTYGPQFANSQLIGGFYNYTTGNLNLVPEVQYQVAKADAAARPRQREQQFRRGFVREPIRSASRLTRSAAGLSISTRTTRRRKPRTDDFWFLGPNAEAVGFSVSPTWQYKYLFARANAGYLYLLNNKGPTASRMATAATAMAAASSPARSKPASCSRA